MLQKYSSKNTSINKAKLPALYSKIDFSKIKSGLTVFDYGCGKYDNAKKYVEDTIQGAWYGYDPFNRDDKQNKEAMKQLVNGIDCIVCTNVLNVIDSEDEIKLIVERILSAPIFFVSVYEGDKSGVGKESKKDCYQRNERVTEYLKYFPVANLCKGVITNHPEFVK